MRFSVNKLKTLYIMKILLEKSDEDHVLSATTIGNLLKHYGYSIDRKTIYSDIETLKEFGLDILQNMGGKDPGYYIGTREFELPELKLMVDAVQSSKFITEKKSRELIKKLEKLTGEEQAKQLHREVFIYNRVKTKNEMIYYNVDEIYTAILSDKKIKFQYTEWTMKKELVPKKAGDYYVVSPWALTWNDENYYLIAYSEEAQKIKHYRVDKIQQAETLADKRRGKDFFDHFNLPLFVQKTFGMYGGYDEKVHLVCKNNLIGVILDRFSKETMIIPVDKEHFSIKIMVSISPQFFGWVAGLGSDVEIEGPEQVREEYKQ
ncbi:MAG: WYL domain-containing transcriptional regulator, partial [Anaerovoracaceae bacterium]